MSDADTIRRLTAECDDLRRDLAELAALDPDGLRAKVVAMREESADSAKYIAQLRQSLSDECDRSAEYYRRASTAEFAANPAVVAHDMKLLREERDAFAANLRLANADVERLAGASVAELLTERRREIRDLTARLNDALAVVDVRDAELARWKATTAFTIDPPQDEADRAFRADHNARHEGEDEGSIGGRYVYSFCVTSIGHLVTLRCSCGASVDLTGDL